MSQSGFHTLVPSGIKGLDDVLLGGFPRNNVILVEGAPGTGKSTLAMEYAYRGATEYNEPAVVVRFETYPERVREDALAFGWDLKSLEEAGKLVLLKITPGEILEDVQTGNGVISTAIKLIGAKRVVLDGLTPLRLHAQGGHTAAYREYMHNLFERFRAEKVTLLCTTEASNSQALGETGAQHEHFLADTILTVRKEAQRRNVNRSLEVSKSRGQDFIAGRNSFRIVNGKGLRVFVRAYARERLAPPVAISKERVSVGVAGLGEMLGGGVYRGSTTLVIGISGTGKSIIATQFLNEGARQGEKGLFITLDETPEAFVRNAESLGFEMQKQVEEGHLKIAYESPLELDLDEHFALVAEAIENSGVKRVVIDSLAAYETILPTDSHEFLFALSSYLKSQGITSMFCYECPEMIGISNLGQNLKASSVADNIVLLNFVEISTRLRRALTVSKTSGAGTDEQTREYVIGRGGVTLLDETSVPNHERVPQLPLSSYYGVLARSPTRHSPIIDEHVASGKPMPKSRVPKPAKKSKLEVN
jgi:circadian clock protein KaiC